jgi:hypothetical protein
MNFFGQPLWRIVPFVLLFFLRFFRSLLAAMTKDCKGNTADRVMAVIAGRGGKNYPGKAANSLQNTSIIGLRKAIYLRERAAVSPLITQRPPSGPQWR